MRGQHDLERVVVASLLCALAALLAPVEAIGLVFAAPLALFFPGYAIVAASFAPRRVEPLKLLLLLSLALSLATLTLGALVLNYAPGGVRPLSWALLLLLVILNGCRVAALRRAPGTTAPRWRLPRPSRADGGLLLGGLGLAVAALVLASSALPAREAVGYTQLWALPAANGSAIQVGVASGEQDPTAYRLLIGVGDRPRFGRDLVLEPGEARVLRIGVPPSAARGPVPVVATLLRQNRPREIYRRVKAWLPPPQSPQ